MALANPDVAESPTTQDTDDEVLDQHDLARLLRLSSRTVRKLKRAGALPPQLVPGRWSRRVVQHWLESGERAARRR